MTLDDFFHVEADGGDRVFLEFSCSKDIEQRRLAAILQPNQSDLSSSTTALASWERDLHFGAPEERAEPVNERVPPIPRGHG